MQGKDYFWEGVKTATMGIPNTAMNGSNPLRDAMHGGPGPSQYGAGTQKPNLPVPPAAPAKAPTAVLPPSRAFASPGPWRPGPGRGVVS